LNREQGLDQIDKLLEDIQECRLLFLGGGTKMQRVNGYSFYAIGRNLRPLADLQGDKKYGEVFAPLFFARASLRELLSSQIVPLNVSKNGILKVISRINTVVPDDLSPFTPEKWEATVYDWQLRQIASDLTALEIVLNAELSGLDVYYISQKGIYATPDLIERAENALPEEIKTLLTARTRGDINQAGRCLAFDLPTAAGFHIMRATESVLLAYHAAFVGKPPNSRNWGAYLADLKGTKAEPKTLGILQQIKDLHRNPTMHEEVLTGNEAFVLFGIGLSAIITMVEEMAKNGFSLAPPPPPLTPVQAPLTASQSGTGSNAP